MRKINYRISFDHGGELTDLFEKGLTFKGFLDLSILPPLRLFNSFLAYGCDDYDDESGVVEWEPFQLNSVEYKELVVTLKERYPKLRVDMDDILKDDLSDWFIKNSKSSD